MAGQAGKRRGPEQSDFSCHPTFLTKQNRLLALAKKALKEQEAKADVLMKHSPYNRSIDVPQAAAIDKAIFHGQTKWNKVWDKCHPQVTADNSRDMIPKLPVLPEIRSETKVKSQQFVPTTRSAAWRITGFKGKDALSGNQEPEGTIHLQDLDYVHFLRQVATVQSQGDSKAVEAQHGGIERSGGVPLIFPYVPKKYDEISPKSILCKQAKEPERPKELKKMERERGLRQKERPRHREGKKSVSWHLPHEDKKRAVKDYLKGLGQSCFVPHLPVTPMRCVCTFCSLDAKRPPPPPNWIDPNILKVKVKRIQVQLKSVPAKADHRNSGPTPTSLCRRHLEQNTHFGRRRWREPFRQTRLSCLHLAPRRRMSGWFLQDADLSETSLQSDSSTLIFPYAPDLFDPELSAFFREKLTDSLLDPEIVKPIEDAAKAMKGDDLWQGE